MKIRCPLPFSRHKTGRGDGMIRAENERRCRVGGGVGGVAVGFPRHTKAIKYIFLESSREKKHILRFLDWIYCTDNKMNPGLTPLNSRYIFNNVINNYYTFSSLKR